MSIAEKLRPFLTLVQSFLSQLPPRSDPPPSSLPTLPASSPSTRDSDSQAVSAPNTQQVQNPNQILLQWQNVVMAFCFTSALEIALLFAQTKSQLPVSFYFLSFVILLVFLSLFVAKFVGEEFVFTSEVLEKVAILLAATSFILTITIPLPLSFKFAVWTLYVVCLFIVVICNKV
ncbi:putative GTPase IMAP family member 1 [Melia azedarach]|uniref:GTPase IMAP family member 1 n=1 Tax=Melia azedarach TaxID=155640 RepID=A0ACC1YLT6_MELAZ|nr:putative GTPase IMAP family member 1 [Melia azedarach]